MMEVMERQLEERKARVHVQPRPASAFDRYHEDAWMARAPPSMVWRVDEDAPYFNSNTLPEPGVDPMLDCHLGRLGPHPGDAAGYPSPTDHVRCN